MLRLLSAFFILSCAKPPQAGPSQHKVMIEIGAVNSDSVDAVKTALQTFAEDPSVGDVYLRINSNGGEINAGLSLIQYFDHYPKKLFCVADTHAYSMGMSILEGCPHRLMTDRATLMMHECRIMEVSGNEHELRNAADACHAMTESMINLASHKMKLTTTQIRAKITGLEWWINSDEAVRVGAVDAIIDPFELPELTALPKSLSSLLDLLRR